MLCYIYIYGHKQCLNLGKIIKDNGTIIKSILLKIIFIIFGNITLLCMNIYILCKRFKVFGVRKSKMSKTIGIY